jgi:hypothetical protein
MTLMLGGPRQNPVLRQLCGKNGKTQFSQRQTKPSNPLKSLVPAKGLEPLTP